MKSPIVTMRFSEATQNRRSIRTLDAKITVPDETIIKLAENALLTIPSAFNSQSTRLTILIGEDHQKLWSITADALLAKIGQNRWNGGTKDRIAGYSDAYGTILFWDDRSCVKRMEENAPDIYKDKTDEWAQQSNGMHQYYMWVALEALGMGANLQHYNPLIDDDVKKTWDIPSGWVLTAQMVFGAAKEGTISEPRQQRLPLEQRLLVFGECSKI